MLEVLHNIQVKYERNITGLRLWKGWTHWASTKKYYAIDFLDITGVVNSNIRIPQNKKEKNMYIDNLISLLIDIRLK